MATELLTRLEAVKYLKISASTFLKFEKAGIIKPLINKQGITNRKRYNPKQLDKVWI